jgi:SAM-dependent methyltransferase
LINYRMSGIRYLTDRIKIPPGPSYNLCYEKLERLVAGLGDSARVLDLGSGGRILRKGAVSLDVSTCKGVSVVADGHRLPFPDESFDLIVCTALLEHVKSPHTVITEMHRCCKRGAMVYVEVPFLQGYHGVPADYCRYTLPGLIAALESFEKLEAGVCCGPASTLSMFLAMLPNALFSSPFLRKLALFLFGWSTFYLKYLDIFLARSEGAHYLASAFYFLGKKS